VPSIANLFVRGNQLSFMGKTYRCAVGKNGFALNKKEGDGCTPLGMFNLRECWFRADKMVAPETNLPINIICENDGWCDDPASEDYNRHIKMAGAKLSPFEIRQGEGFSFEKLHRNDHIYDLIIPIGYNDNPPVMGKGSAIFLHLAHDDYRGTEGCVALAQQDLLDIIPFLSITTQIEIFKS